MKNVNNIFGLFSTQQCTEASLVAENEDARASKKRSREKSRAILENILDEKGPIDWSDDPSDFEDEMKRNKRHLYIDSSDDEMKDEKQKKSKQIKHQDNTHLMSQHF